MSSNNRKRKHTINEKNCREAKKRKITKNQTDDNKENEKIKANKAGIVQSLYKTNLNEPFYVAFEKLIEYYSPKKLGELGSYESVILDENAKCKTGNRSKLPRLCSPLIVPVCIISLCGFVNFKFFVRFIAEIDGVGLPIDTSDVDVLHSTK